MDTLELTPEEVAATAAAGWRSPAEFCRIFLPTWFKTKMPWVHRGLLALRTGQPEFLLDFGEEWWPRDKRVGKPSHWTVDDLIKIVTNFVIEVKPPVRKDGVVIQPAVLEPIFTLDMDADGHIVGIRITRQKDNEAFILPRGYSKTTLINAMNLRGLVYKEDRFILYVSETATHADNQVMTVRRQLEQNQLLRLVFGDLVPDRTSSNKWTDSEIELTNGCRLSSVGTGGQVRGTSKDATRPTRIVVDDFQDAETIRKSETQREKDLRWFLQVLMPARMLLGDAEDGDEITKMDVVGTMPHKQAVIALLMQDPDWMPVRFGAFDRQNQLLWEWAIDADKLTKLRGQYERMGQLDVFDLEYMSNLPDDDGVAFPTDKIIYINRPSEWFIAKCVVADPAISENPKADYFALGALGMGKFGDIHLIDCRLEVGVDFDDQSEWFFDMHFAHCLDLPPDQVKHGVESIAYQRALKSSIESKQHAKSKTWGPRAYFEVTPITHGRHDGSKIMRVQGLLAPRVKSGHVSFERQFGTLKSQLDEWPNGKKDGPDMLAMGIGLLDPYSSAMANVANDQGEPVPVSQMSSAGWSPAKRAWRKAP
jgi:hypothetical protein